MMLDVTSITESSIHIHGFCPWNIKRLAQALSRGLKPEDLPGDCVVTANGTDSNGAFEIIISSALSCHNYYWYQTDGSLVHGPMLFEVIRRAGLRWIWNIRAVFSLLTAGYTIGSDTLHKQVHRFPASSKVIWREIGMQVSQSSFWDQLFNTHSPPSHVDESETALRNALTEALEPRIALSLSAGFDSRVILALLLSQGIKPIVGTMGFANSTDMRVASAISKQYGLEHHRVELRAHDYLTHARAITELTGGSKPANHWHTYIFIKRVDYDSRSLHLAGTNGEFARTTWFDRNPLAQIVDRLPFDFATRIIRQRFRSGPYAVRYREALDLIPDSLDGQRISDVPQYFAQLAAGNGTSLSRLDRFVALHPTRHFIGNGFTLYNSVIRTFSPFLDAGWISTAARLPRIERIGSNFHRHVISSHCPSLLNYPIGKEKRVHARAPWNAGNPKKGDIPYAEFDAVRKLKSASDLLRSSKYLLSLFDGDKLNSAIARPALFPALMALHFAAEAGHALDVNHL